MGKLSRRQMFLALGSIAGGMGMIVGTGAFSTVEAQRDVQIQSAGDSSALVALDPAGSGTIVDNSSDVIGFDVSGADGVNQNARTTFRPAMKVTNNGSNTVGLYIEDATDVGEGEVLDFQENGSGSSIVGTSSAIDLDTGSTNAVELDLVIDLIGVSANKLEDINSVTIVADEGATSS